nr:redoxin domain-containing protein [Sphingobacterium sp. UBA5996]
MSILQSRVTGVAGKLALFKQHGVSLLAISPQMPRYNDQLRGDLALDFEWLFDEDNMLANNCGISFELQDYANSTYNKLGIRLSEYNGNDNNGLPAPAVFVIDKDCRVSYRFLDVTYTNRISIDELLATHMSKIQRKGAKRITDIPLTILESLNRGEIETANLVEWLAIDQTLLLENVLKQNKRRKYAIVGKRKVIQKRRNISSERHREQ